MVMYNRNIQCLPNNTITLPHVLETEILKPHKYTKINSNKTQLSPNTENNESIADATFKFIMYRL